MPEFPIKPCGDKVIIKFFEGEDTTKSGLVVAFEKNQKYKFGEVMATGRGIVADGVLLPPEVKVGDLVQTMSRVGDEVKVGTEIYYLISERHILAILDKSVAPDRVLKNQVLSESK